MLELSSTVLNSPNRISKHMSYGRTATIYSCRIVWWKLPGGSLGTASRYAAFME
jgi:hypothetical protein